MPLDVFTIALWVGAGIWQGIPGLLIFLVALILGGIGLAYNQSRYGP